MLTLNKLRAEYQSKHNLEFSNETLRKHIRQTLNFSFKRINIKNYRTLNYQYKMMNYIFISEFIKAKQQGGDFIWIDESGFSNDRRSKYG